MKLNLEQIKSITVGSLSVIECDGYYRFFKCTEKQMRAWYEHGSETLGDRARTTSGVRLDFLLTRITLRSASPAEKQRFLSTVCKEAYSSREKTASSTVK